MRSYIFNPCDYGFSLCQPQDLVGGSPDENKQIALDILTGKEQGAKRDAVIINSAACIYLGLDDTSIEQAIVIAREMLDSKKAFSQLQKFIELSNEE